MNKTVLEALNKQANFEMYSGYIYLQLSMQMERLNYKGYAAWLFKQYQEEFEHAHDFIRFIQKRDEEPTMLPIEVANIKVSSPLEAAELALKHEKAVTARIYELNDLAKQEKDYATELFAHQYIVEQIEEEDTAQDIVDRFTLTQDSTSAMYAVDQQLASRNRTE